MGRIRLLTVRIVLIFVCIGLLRLTVLVAFVRFLWCRWFALLLRTLILILILLRMFAFRGLIFGLLFLTILLFLLLFVLLRLRILLLVLFLVLLLVILELLELFTDKGVVCSSLFVIGIE